MTDAFIKPQHGGGVAAPVYSVLVTRWPVAGESGECITTLGVEPQISGKAEVTELVNIKFDAHDVSAFTLKERDGFARAFLPLFKCLGQKVSVNHASEKFTVIVLC
jgi:hypothetical protein